MQGVDVTLPGLLSVKQTNDLVKLCIKSDTKGLKSIISATLDRYEEQEQAACILY